MNFMAKNISTKLDTPHLFAAVCRLVIESKASIAIAVNQRLTMLYSSIGKMIKTEILQNQRQNMVNKSLTPYQKS